MTKPRYKAVLFDIDDTLLKTWEPKWRQHKFVAKQYYDIDLSDKTLQAHWGKPFDKLAEALYQGRGTREERRTNFIHHELEFPKEYEPHALETIEALHEAGVALGLMTSMYWDGALVDLRNLRVPLDYFVVQQGAEATEFHKPDGRWFEPALKTLTELGIEAQDVVYVGEALSDMQAARAGGVNFIAVTQGFFSADDFSNAGEGLIFVNLSQARDAILGGKSN
jgi:phosphoglycolate phosphatase-like HAD superfamily hydrolase